MILALDVSTSITGYTLMNEDGSIETIGHIDLRKAGDFFEKARLVGDTLLRIEQASYKIIDTVYIEQPFSFFKSGGSSARTMATLQRFNGVVSWQCYDLFGTTPHYFTAAQARKLVGIRIPRGQKAKQIVLDFVLDNVPEFEIEYTKFGNPRPGYIDRADSYVVAKAGWNFERQEIKSTN